MKTKFTSNQLEQFLSHKEERYTVEGLAEATTRCVTVKNKLTKLYRSLNTGGIELPFNVMEGANVIDWLIDQIKTKIVSDGVFSDGALETTLLSDKGVEWLNEINETVEKTKTKKRTNEKTWSEGDELDEMVKEFMEDLDNFLMYEDRNDE